MVFALAAPCGGRKGAIGRDSENRALLERDGRGGLTSFHPPI
jgi:hypothetical protein